MKLFLAIALLATPVLADTFGEWTYSVANGEATITGYSGSGGAVVIPSEVNGIPVRKIGNEWPPVFGFPNNSITSLTIPQGISIIGNHAIYGCTSLTNVSFPSTLSLIGEGAFQECSSLSQVIIPNSVTIIRGWAFNSCTSLNRLTLSSGLIKIEESTFQFCTSLTNIVIPNSVTHIGANAFLNNTALTNVTLNYGLKNIGPLAFKGSGIKSVSIPNSVTNISDGAFWNCSSLTNVVLPNGLSWISSRTFEGCSSLLSILIPSGVTNIRDFAFANCSNLKSVSLPSTLESIWDSAFQDCTTLKSISLPNSITYAGNSVFQNCTNLDGIVFHGNAPGLGGNWNNCPATIYRLSTSSGWGSSFAGLSVVEVTSENIDSNLDGISDQRAISLGYDRLLSFFPLISSLKINPVSGLFNQSQYDSNRVTGRNDVINSPNSYSLYTTNQIQNLGIGGIMLNRNTNNLLVLNYQILQSSDLQNWSSYQNNELVISNAPTNKMFLRVQAVGQ